MPNNWKPEEDAVIKETLSTTTYAAIAEQLGRTPTAIRHRAQRLGLSRPPLRYRALLEKPLPPMSETQIGYLAGLIDGEGSIGLYRAKTKTRVGFRLQPTVSVSGTDPRLAEYLIQTLNASVHMRTRAMKNSRPTWQIVWAGYRSMSVLETIEPLLIVKRDQAKILIAYMRRRLQGELEEYSRTYTEEDLADYETLKVLNRLGLSGWRFAHLLDTSMTLPLPQKTSSQIVS